MKSHCNGSTVATIVILFLSLLPTITIGAQPSISAVNYDYHDGDLIFVLPREANAITTVTQGSACRAADHVAILHRIGGSEGLPYAIEAISKGVCLTPIDSFISHNAGCDMIVARLTQIDASASVRNALRYVGRPYDFFYDMGDSALYCSELVQLAVVDSDGKKLFGTIPMSFHDSQGNITPHWHRFYARHNREVPEGAPGTNPTQLLSAVEVLKAKCLFLIP